MADSVQFPIGYVSMMTGVSAHSLRAWERRYRAVTPTRTTSGHRLYSQEDIDRIALLKQAVDAGHHISHVAGLDPAALESLTTPVKPSFTSPSTKERIGAQPIVSRDVIPSCLQAIEALDGAALHRILRQASLKLSRQALLDTLIIPLMRKVGQRWSEGSLRIMHEHLASNAVHAHLCHMLDYPAPTSAELPRTEIAPLAGGGGNQDAGQFSRGRHRGGQRHPQPPIDCPECHLSGQRHLYAKRTVTPLGSARKSVPADLRWSSQRNLPPGHRNHRRSSLHNA